VAVGKELVDVEIDFFPLKMKDGKYHVYKRIILERPKIITKDLEITDTLEEAMIRIAELYENL
jgi:hypothetical protein